MADDTTGKALSKQLDNIIGDIDFGDLDDYIEDGPEPIPPEDEKSDDDEGLEGADDAGDEVETAGDEGDEEDAGEDGDESEEPEAEGGTDPFAEFARTGNPNVLPDGEFKDRVMELMRHDVQVSQQLSEARRVIEMLSGKQEPAKGGEEDAAEDPMPTVDLTADEDVIVKQIADVAAWAARQEARRIEREMAELKQHQQAQQQMQEQQKLISELEEYVRSLDGFTPEIEQKMGEFMQQHAEDPEWRQLFMTKAGLKLIFDNVRGVYSTATKQDEVAKRAAAAKKASQPRIKSRKAAGMDTSERFKGLKPEEKVEKAVQEALARAAGG